MILAVLVLVAVLAACAQEPPTPTVEPIPTEEPAPVEAQPTEAVATAVEEAVTLPAMLTPAADIINQPWTLIGYGDAGNPTVVEPGTTVTLIFDDEGVVSGSGGCNSFFGSYTAADDGTLTIDEPLGSTMMACEQGMEQEAAFLAALPTVTSFMINDAGRLELAYDSGQPFDETLVFSITETPLLGTTWRLESFGDPADLQPVEAGIGITAIFEGDSPEATTGTLAGYASCNNYTTSFTIDGSSLTVGQIATTLRACISGEEQEAAYLAALQTAQSFEIVGSRLTITTDNGVLIYNSLNLPLENVLWQAVSVGGQMIPDGVTVTALFAAGDEPGMGQVGGTSGCNNYFTSFETDGESLTIGPIAGTMMACPDEQGGAIEAIYTAALSSAESFQVAGTQLLIQTAEGTIVYAADREPLEGTLWTLISVGTEDSPMAPMEGSQFTAVFDRIAGVPSGIVSGSTGCNDYNATYAANLTEIKVNLPVRTNNDCPNPDMQLEAEQQFFLGLNSATSYRILGNILQIPYGEPAQVLTFEATPLPVETVDALDLTPLANTFWFLSAIGDTPVLAGTQVTGQFDINDDGITGVMGGTAGCNNYNAPVGANFAIGEIATTAKLCEQAIMDQEATYLSWLRSAQGFSRVGDQLLIPTANGVLTFNSTPILDQSNLLVNTNWFLVSYETLTPVPGANPTALFAADGRSLSGNTGCNTYTGAFNAGQGNTLAISDIATSLAACPSDALTQQQDTFNRLMISAVSYSISGSALQIRTVDGGTMNFTSNPPAGAVDPTAVINGPTTADVGQSLTFDANGSQPGSARLTGFQWDMGDGGQLTGSTVQYSYATPGTYTVTLTVVDLAGRTGTATQTVTVNAVVEVVPPIAVIDGPTVVSVGELATFSAAGSTPGSNPIASFAWQSGDGNNTEAAPENTFSTIYGVPGTYRVSVTVFDANGLSSTAGMTVVVNASLQGTVWSLDSAAPGTAVTLQFGNGAVTGSAGCNTYNGKYTTTMMAGPTNNINIGPVSTTQLICSEDIMAQETAFLAQLQTATSYTISGTMLTLDTPEGPMVFSYIQAVTLPAPLSATP
jgi:heat shock protein HslJ